MSITNDTTAVYREPAERIRAVAAAAGITLDENRIRGDAERGREGNEVWRLVGALTEAIAQLVEAKADGDPVFGRIVLEVAAEKVVAWEEADVRRRAVATPGDSCQ